MAKVREDPRNLSSCHIAVEAARAVGLVADDPIESAVLKRSKSLVVRIRSTSGPDIIAKQSSARSALAEARVYDEVLSLLSEGHVRLLDRLIRDETGWLFLEDAGDVAMDKHEPVMRYELGRLLGRSAATTSRMRLDSVLPQYTSQYFSAVLADVQRRLGAALATSPTGRSPAVLKDALHWLERVEASWPTIANAFVEGPEVLCHADLTRKNIRLRGLQREMALIDWELAGRGPLAVDLGCVTVPDVMDPLLVGFGREFDLSGRLLFEQASLGRFLRLVHAMYWATEKDLSTASAERGRRLLEYYCQDMERAFAQLPYGRVQRSGS